MARTFFAIALFTLVQTAPLDGAASQDAKKVVGEQRPQTPGRQTDDGRISAKDAGFSIVPPKGWVKGGTEGNTILSYLGPKSESAPNFNVRMVNYDDTPLDKFAAQLKELMPKQFKAWKLLDEKQMTVDGKKTYTIASLATVDIKGKDLEIKTLQYCIVGANKKLYILTFTAIPTVFDQQRKLYEEAALTTRTD
jgi:hypothetical protein